MNVEGLFDKIHQRKSLGAAVLAASGGQERPFAEHARLGLRGNVAQEERLAHALANQQARRGR